MKSTGYCFLFLMLIFPAANYGCGPEYRGKREGNAIIEKIESYKSANNSLPDDLGEVGIADTVPGFRFHYRRYDTVYTLSFGVALGESVIYYSDSGKWEDTHRPVL